MTVLIIVIDGLDFDAFVETSPSFLKCMRLAGEIPTWDDIIAQLAKHSQQFAVLYKDVILDTLNSGQLVLSLAIGQLVNDVRAQVEKLTQRSVENVVVDDFEYQVIVEADPEAGGYVVECPAIKGCISQGETKEEALIMIQDAIAACLEVLEERGTHAEVA